MTQATHLTVIYGTGYTHRFGLNNENLLMTVIKTTSLKLNVFPETPMLNTHRLVKN